MKTSSPNEDTTSAIVKQLAQNNIGILQPVILIIVESKMGKTLALKLLRMEMFWKMPTTWTVVVDLAEIVNDYIVNHFIQH